MKLKLTLLACCLFGIGLFANSQTNPSKTAPAKKGNKISKHDIPPPPPPVEVQRGKELTPPPPPPVEPRPGKRVGKASKEIPPPPPPVEARPVKKDLKQKVKEVPVVPKEQLG